MSRETIKVVCRMRPENNREKDSGCKLCLTHTKDSVRVNIENEGSHDFSFDRVFGSDSRQDEVFEYAAKPIIQGAMDGYNGTLFCYGQTSSGKTHTMEGLHHDPDLRGILPRTMEYVFELIKNASNDLEFTVKCSYLEIYNEKILDLIDPTKNNLIVKEEKSKGIWIDDATEIYVTSKEEMFQVFRQATSNRTVGATLMNAKSSRSHSLFIVTIFQKNSKTDSTRMGKLYFVDLAGSEKMSKTGAEGQMLKEAQNINKSLLTLGMVINALTEGKTHVPYRESKLTRVLQESIGGNSQTTLIITCSMSAFNDRESLSTLNFGKRAKNIKNKIVVNTERSAKELLIKLNEAEEKIKNYQNIIAQMSSGGDIINLLAKESLNSQPNISLYSNTSKIRNSEEGKKCEECSNAMRKILNQHIELVTLQDEYEKAKLDKEELEQEIETRNLEVREMNERLIVGELRTKLFIEDELKTFQELQIRLENMFLLNQNKLFHSNKLRSVLEKTRYEIILLIRSNRLKIEKNTDNILNEEMNNYNKNLEESLEILNKIEEMIINDNKNFNDLVEFILGRQNENSENDNFESIPENENSSSTKTVNNINLNINKNISINIIKSKKRRRRNSVSFVKTSNSSNNVKSRNILTKSCNPIKKLKTMNFNTCPSNKYLTTNNVTSINPFTLDKELEENEEYEQNSEMSGSEKYDDEEDLDMKNLISDQRKTIKDLAQEYVNIKESLASIQKENIEKEVKLNMNSENMQKTETKVKEYEEIIKDLNDTITKKEEEFERYKQRSMEDLQHKEKKMVDLINRVGDLEDENYKIINFNKDKDKKKFYMMEKQVKELTTEISKLINENINLKSQNEKKSEEAKSLYLKISDLENKLVQSVKNKMHEVSFSCQEESGLNTPNLTNYLYPKQFNYASLNEILSTKLRQLSSLSTIHPSVSPKSNDPEKRSSDSSIINFQPNMSNPSSAQSKLELNKKTYKVNVRPNPSIGNFNMIKNINTNLPMSSNNNSPINQIQNNGKIMRIIRGGGGQDYNSNQNHFFSKMLNKNESEQKISIPKAVSGKKINIDKIKKEKYEQELQMLDTDEMNNSKESEAIEEALNTMKSSNKTPKGGLWNMFSKITGISK